MQHEKTDIFWKTLTVSVLVLLLLGVRAFEDRLFYDPFLSYFKGEYLTRPLPVYDRADLFFGLTFRYFVNTVLSLGIIYVLFPDAGLLRFTSVLYVVLFVLLMALFFGLLLSGSQNKFLLFYARRFLIQPLFLLLFVPAFYYQNRVSKK